jgi:hypothetical protein
MLLPTLSTSVSKGMQQVSAKADLCWVVTVFHECVIISHQIESFQNHVHNRSDTKNKT